MGMPERPYRTKRQTLRARKLRREVSKAERRLWLHLRNEQLGVPFRRQHPVGPFYADYFCVPLKIAVEIDGPWHDPVADSERDNFMQKLGVTVLRFSVQEMDEALDGVVARIEQEIWLLTNSRKPPES
jgi:very-short-patch-repair endonuclease